MDHDYIASRGIVDLYVTGRLPEDDAERLEEHLLECHRCQDEVEMLRDLRLGLEQSPRIPEPDRISWWRRIFAVPAPAWALAGMALVALPALLQLRSDNLRIAQLSAEDAHLRGAAADSARNARAAVAIPVLSLALTRGAGDGARAPVPRIRLGEQPALAVTLEYVPDPVVTKYRATLEGPDGKPVAAADSIAPPATGDTLGIEFRSGHFAPGRYAVLLEGTNAAGRSAPLGRFAFESLP